MPDFFALMTGLDRFLTLVSCHRMMYLRGIMNKKRHIVSLIIITVVMTSLLCGCELNGGDKSKLKQGMDCLKALDYQSAATYFEESIADGIDIQQAYRGAGMAYLGLSRYDDAISAFEKALGEANGVVHDIELDISYYLAIAEVKKGDLLSAYNTYSAIIAMDEDRSDARYLRGKVCLEQGNVDQALSDYDQAIIINPSDYDMYIRIYQDLEERGYPSQAQGYIARALDRDGKKSNYQLGLLSYYMGNYEDARNYLEIARESKDSEELVTVLGKTYEALGDYNYAISLYEAFLDKNSNSATVYNKLGAVKLELGDYQGALMAFDSGIATGDTTYKQSMMFNEIVCYEYLGDFNKALVQMEEYLKLYPNDGDALREYEFLKTR